MSAPASAPVAAPDGLVAILAGSGELPLRIAERLAAAGRPYRILALRGFASPALARQADATVGVLDVTGTLARLDAWQPACVTLAGGLKRPGFAAALDAFSLLLDRAQVAEILGRGDDTILRGAARLLEERGHRLVGLRDLAPELLAEPGTYGTVAPDAEARRSVAVGLAVIDGLSPFDIGQSVVVHREQVLAIEGPEGTDAMIARAGRLRRGFALRRPQAAGILVKAAKTGQDRRVDLPAIGPRTVARAARAGLSGLAIGAGETIVIDKAATVALADRLGLFVVAVARPARGEAAG